MQCPTPVPTASTLSVSDAHALMIRSAFAPRSRPLSIAHPGLCRRPSLTVTPPNTNFAHLVHEIGVENVITRTNNVRITTEHVPACDSQGAPGMGMGAREDNIRQLFRRRDSLITPTQFEEYPELEEKFF